MAERLFTCLLLAAFLGACDGTASIGAPSFGLTALAIGAEGRWLAGGAGGAFVIGRGDDAQARLGNDAQPITALLWDGNHYLVLDYALLGDVGLDGGTRDHLHRSPDGRRWEHLTLNSVEEFQAFHWNGQRYLALGMNGGVLYSEDGENWILTHSDREAAFTDLAWDGTRYLATTYGGRVHHSTDGLVWDEVPRISPRPLNGLARADDGLWVAVGNGGALLTSADGNAWTPQTSGTDAHLFDVAWGGGWFVAVGMRVLLTSEDGSHWRALPLTPAAILEQVRWDAHGDRFLAIGLNSAVFSWRPGEAAPRAIAIDPGPDF